MYTNLPDEKPAGADTGFFMNQFVCFFSGVQSALNLILDSFINTLKKCRSNAACKGHNRCIHYRLPIHSRPPLVNLCATMWWQREEKSNRSKIAQLLTKAWSFSSTHTGESGYISMVPGLKLTDRGPGQHRSRNNPNTGAGR